MGFLARDPKSPDIADKIFGSRVARVTGHVEQRTLRQRHTALVADRLCDTSQVGGMSERP
ncbi:hypothetical protein A5641_04560 [Mycobacterium sp. 1554424.7]|nr:hypothetical protein A5641_04560 [Mycobacterium sp. 1554424.7]